ncbi:MULTISPECIES: glycosyltransferase [Cyanophyceae]|uniref:glycosyltransferase n=1 Tax=Cyanophyceae TaxID=3028117 RepID=UPI0016836635|nr:MULTISPECIES: glycosyltransferase [Cyanophyceae]MBD1918183.1 glycosyltransferase [Phormidium sp. FACHB-77]MBD2030215.1 glycosyltransferase [Phormidium sp. FACHB-322]MBD2051413.1 glycosyltransferase [Leptolyngbya sp. FACHB-60]
MKVSVLVITYNHISFIAKALDSVLMQDVNFDYELLISEDCSTDGTREVVLAYYNRFPDKIRLLLSKKNIRSNQVVARGINAAKGQYIALLDGDDYWISPHKLQKQVDFLDRHSECAICFHNAKVVHEDSSQAVWNWTPENQKEFSTLEDIWMGNFIATCSTMFRQGLFGRVPTWYDDFFPITDWPLHLLNAEHGLIGYIDEVMGVYRYHSGGLYSPFTQVQKLYKTLDFYQAINSALDFRYDEIIKTAISKYFLEWADEFFASGNMEQARVCFKVCATAKPINKYISIRRFLRTWFKLYLLPRVRSTNLAQENY